MEASKKGHIIEGIREWVKTAAREDLQGICLQLAETLERLDNDARRLLKELGVEDDVLPPLPTLH
jgi:hypothetical protein